MARKNISAAVVRAWAVTPEGFQALADAVAPMPGKRGRLHADTLDVFHAQNKGLVYEQASEAEKPSVTFKAVVLDSAGRKTTRSITLTTEAARDLLGHPKGKVGRLSHEMLGEAYSAQVAAEAADTFTKAA
jgi:hypothetical protein